MQTDKITQSRRDFLKTSALLSGGLLIGFNLFNSCESEARPPVDIEDLDFKDFNAFIKIAENGKVSIFAPNPEIGQGVKTSMPMIIAEELDVKWEDVHVVQAPLDTEKYTRQVAGGSQSIRQGWEPLRQTGATARQMLINAAAIKWGVKASECKTKEGEIMHSSGKKLSYGDVAEDAAKLEVPEDYTLKKPSEFNIIGTDAFNVDIDEIINGKPLFGIDFKREGMLNASVLRPPAFGQKLVSFDDTETLKVKDVLQTIKFGDKIAVLAKTTYAAMKGKEALKAEWEFDTAGESSSDHDKILNELLDGNKFETKRKDGNINKAFSQADKIIERAYEAPFLPHNTLEPMNFFADVHEDKVELVGPIQTPARTAENVAELLERDISEISLEMTRQGGGFGRRLYGDFALEAAEISQKAKKPIHLLFTREDDMTAGTYRVPLKYRFKAAIKNGQITAYHIKEAAINSNMYSLIPDFFPAGGIENYQVDIAKYDSNITTGAWRAPITNFHAFAEQSFFEEVAENIGKDSIQLRLELLEKIDKNKDNRITYEPKRFAEVIKMAVEKSDWGKKKEGVYQGFASYYCHNSQVAEVAEIEIIDEEPKVKKVTVAIDCGIVVNPMGAVNQAQGGVIDGIGHAMYGDFGFENGKPKFNNFGEYRLIRMNETPQVDIHFVENDLAPTGLGEPPLPPAAPAVANAIYAATGKRITKFPMLKNFKEL